MNRFLVPLDESPTAEAALGPAAALAKAAGAELILVRAPDRPPPGVRPYEVRGGAVSYAEEYLALAADRLREGGIAVRSATLPDGPVPQAILDAVRERETCLVVMATHGRSGLGRWVYGNVTNGVLARCPVPVLVVRSWLVPEGPGEFPPGTPVLVPLDGSEYARAALKAAAALAGDIGGRVVELTVSVGPPGPAIVAAAAEQNALVLMTAHGRGAPGRQFLGNVADYVLRTGTTPLIIAGPAIA